MKNFICPNGCCTIKIKPYKKINAPFENFQKQRKKAGVFIYDPKKDKVLLVQSRGNFWGLPKGTIQSGETEIECAIREVKEETGLSITDNFTKVVKIYNKGIYFYMEMEECDVNVQDHIYGNDANGICWIKLKCLEKCIENGDISLNKHCQIVFKKFKNKVFVHYNLLNQ